MRGNVQNKEVATSWSTEIFKSPPSCPWAVQSCTSEHLDMGGVGLTHLSWNFFSPETPRQTLQPLSCFFILDIISLLGSRIMESEFCKYPFPILMIIDQRSCLAASGNKVVTTIKFHFRNMFYSRDCQTDCQTILSTNFRNKYPGTAAFLLERPGTGSRKLWVLSGFDRERRCGHQFLPTRP